ncbi:ribbon-helix-helix domain-containing protein [Arthrobacter castelli]|uniref:ribbon-helix-helix domain-containing protein n=1 Tax=Arthrobacter castelli TaxID=271431 RepID=UPI0004797461|nr:ribbon-helix-helix domain-containing protein [Arthrobacter castelli]
MSKQIAVRLPEDLVAFLDSLVTHGRAPSRAAAVAHAVERERRNEIAARDAAILARTKGDVDDLDALADFAVATPMEDLD